MSVMLRLLIQSKAAYEELRESNIVIYPHRQLKQSKSATAQYTIA